MMQDAHAGLRAAIDELREAERALPDDLAARVRAVIERTEGVLRTLDAAGKDGAPPGATEAPTGEGSPS